MLSDNLLRYSTPERMTYHLPPEEQQCHHLEITFINELIKEPTATVHFSEEAKTHLLS